MKKSFFLLVLSICLFFTSLGQQANDDAYRNVVSQRSAKIVQGLQLSDSTQAGRVKKIISGQYLELNRIQTVRDAAIKAARSSSDTSKAAIAARVKSLQEDADQKILQLHGQYVKQLSKELTPAQVDQVKDGMTYGVVPITYKGYQAMIPELTARQKEQILAWLVEAREHAMDAETSEKKHAWFGKYKGRINNYLSAAGYDLKKAGEDWEKRRNAEKSVSGN